MLETGDILSELANLRLQAVELAAEQLVLAAGRLLGRLEIEGLRLAIRKIF